MTENTDETESRFENAVIIAITGGIGSGKTVVADILKKEGKTVVSTDEIAKRVMTSDKNVIGKIISAFGEDSYNQAGSFNSKYISDIVFSESSDSSAQLTLLNSIVHPTVIELMIEEIETNISKGENPVFVESALVFEAGLDEGFDYVVCVTAKDDLRIKRVSARSKLTEKQIFLRMNQQISQEEKIRLSDFQIENNKSIADLNIAVKFLLPILESLPPKKDFTVEVD